MKGGRVRRRNNYRDSDEEEVGWKILRGYYEEMNEGEKDMRNNGDMNYEEEQQYPNEEQSDKEE